MKLVVYSKEQYYFLTDGEFELAVESWDKKKPIYFKKLQIFLPPPRNPAGMPPEHAQLQLAFTFSDKLYGTPGWIGIQKPTVDSTGTEIKRGALFVRVKDHASSAIRFVWHDVAASMSSEQVKSLIDSLKPKMIDDILEDTELRNSISFEPLLSEYNLN